ncbi:NAD-dependent epimerase/dehydratase family protein [Planctomycetota bacterium]
MRTIVIGGTGHIGTYLVPRLVKAGHTVTCISRGKREPYHENEAWESATMVQADRRKETKEGTFTHRLKELEPDILIDIMSYSIDNAKPIVEGLTGHISHFLAAGTLWVHGYGIQQPITEEAERTAVGNYGIEKAKMEAYLLEESDRNGFPATVLHPGHITGPGWDVVNPQGNHNPKVFEMLAKGEAVAIPNWGNDHVHHVHADDVAQGFMKTIENRDKSIGQSFHILAPQAITLRGFAEQVCAWFDKEPRLTFLPWEEWKKTVSEEDADDTYGHISRGLIGSIDKARNLIGYDPAYSSLEAVKESVEWMISNKVISI